MNALIIITEDIYNGNWLVDELSYHIKQAYDKIMVFDVNNSFSNNMIEIDGIEINAYGIERKRLKKYKQYLPTLADSIYRDECRIINKQYNANLRCKIRAIDYLATANTYANQILACLAANQITDRDNIVFYSYWMSVHCESLFFLKRKFPKSILITRCHNVDIYSERMPYGYLEYRRQILCDFDRIFCVSKDGKIYLESKLGKTDKIEVARLGTKKLVKRSIEANVEEKRIPFCIISSSRIEQVKRIDRIIEVLSKIEDIDIKWIHYGTGSEKERMCNIAERILPDNVKYEFRGFVSHNVLLEELCTRNIDVLINLSEFEGVPVSMMEALSIGIPIIATDAGGVRELVVNGETGFLCSQENCIIESREYIYKMYHMNDCEMMNMRESCVKQWNTKYNENINYMEFAKKIKGYIC